ncbi:hypothetical protein YC2023_065293 [Brassica napus]
MGSSPSSLRGERVRDLLELESSKLWRRRNQAMEKKKMEFAKPLSQLNPNIHCFLFISTLSLVYVSRPLSLSHRLHTSLFPRSSVADMQDSDDITQLGVVICEDLSAADGRELPVAACARVVILD